MSVTLGIVGAGNIAGPYITDLQTSNQLTIAGLTDALPERARALADEHGLRVYDSLDALLADDGVDLVVNLTIHHAHYAVNKACLEAGKHVYSEKPLALTFQQAKELVGLAQAKGLRLAAAPFTSLFESHQTAWRYVRAGELGRVRLVYAEANWGRMETWHPHPEAYYGVGPLRDVGVYPLTFLTGVFGPVRKVTSYATTLKADRVTLSGDAFELGGPDFTVCMLEHASNVLTRLTANFYVTHSSKQGGVEIHGDERSLFLSSWLWPSGTVEVAGFNAPYKRVPLENSFVGEEMQWGTGVKNLVGHMLDGTPHLGTGAHAAHVVEVLEAAYASVARGEAVAVTSNFDLPEPV